MILVSCRKNFDSDRAFSNANQVEGMTDAALASQVKDKHVVILIHGYRSPLSGIRAAYKTIEEKLAAEGLLSGTNYGEVIGFAWPSFRARISFPAAVPYANIASEYLYDLMKLLSQAKTIDLQTHSLGARVALQGLAGQSDVKSDNLILTAPAVDNECLQPNQEFNEALSRTKRCYVLHSKKDAVLRFYTLLSLDRALGKNGPQHPDVIRDKCPNVYTVDCQRVTKSDHSGYRKTPVYYQFWKKVLEAPNSIPRVSAWE
jgi:esterase/lipase superfamily enzyme